MESYKHAIPRYEVMKPLAKLIWDNLEDSKCA